MYACKLLPCHCTGFTPLRSTQCALYLIYFSVACSSAAQGVNRAQRRGNQGRLRAILLADMAPISWLGGRRVQIASRLR